uniref:hypothetical protein n=1 Tax=Dictyotopsis propagulifera TaxID=670095 RepID=UPI002E79A52A|nr:hypothetical protein V2485_pgp073 [Dictyotopsis propagulifera]WAM63184.1 hypothetical protein [Dictyotopsis propagulifera]
MEIIDISKFYRFQSIPNPLIIASDILFSKEDTNNKQRSENFSEIEDLTSKIYPSNKSYQLNHKQNLENILQNYKGKHLQKDNENRVLEKNLVRKILNQISIYLIVQIKTVEKVEKNEGYVLLPISNVESLSNTAISRLYLHRDGLFEINADPMLYFPGKPPDDHRFYTLDELLSTQGVFDSELDTKMKNIKLETEDDILKRKGLKGKLLGDDPKFYSLPKYEYEEYLPNLDPDPEVWRDEDKDSIWVQKYGIPRQDYEYNEAEFDNMLFNNPVNYCSGIEKNIFPIFESLEDAENFLLIALEDLLEPFRKKRIGMKQEDFLMLTKREQYLLLLPSSYLLRITDSEIFDPVNLDYLDNSNQSLNEHEDLTKTRIDLIKSWFARRRWIKSYTRIEPPYQIANYDQNAFVPLSNSFLLDKIINTKVIKIGLGDFLDIWFSEGHKSFKERLSWYLKGIKDFKKGEILFIPKLKQSGQKPLEVKKLYQLKNTQHLKKNSIDLSKIKISYEIGKPMSLSEVEDILRKFKQQS